MNPPTKLRFSRNHTATAEFNVIGMRAECQERPVVIALRFRRSV
jgi:hypothetical protein